MAFFGEPDREDYSECVQCGSDMGRSVELVCSATCYDLLNMFSREPSYVMDCD